MKRLLVSIAALSLVLAVFSSRAYALGCEVKEYAQYKDQARTKDGRRQLAIDYCLNKKLFEIRQAYMEPCSREMSKQLDALRSVKATAAINYAVGGCEGPEPK